MRLAVVYRGAGGAGPDAIAQYSALLTDALSSCADLRTPAELLEHGADAAILQYNPFSYGRRGFAPDLLRDWREVGAQGTRRLVMIHEPYVPIRGWRSALMGGWQRTQLAALLSVSDRILVSSEEWRTRLPRFTAGAIHAPVPSLLPDRRARREAIRRKLSVEGHELVVGTLSSGHPSHLTPLAEAAVARIAASGRQTMLLLLGAGARPATVPANVRVVRPGQQPSEDLAAHVAACDLFLAPLVDGVSTRRTSMMAALQHEVAVLGTATPATDQVFYKTDAVRTVAAADAEGYANAAHALAADDPGRRALGIAGRGLYEASFAWDRTAALVREAAE